MAVTEDPQVFRPFEPRFRPPVPRDMRRRRLSGVLRALPDFLLVGAMKAGTTSLYYYLTRHPRILQSPVKEVHYFDIAAERPLSYYRCFFPLRAKLRRRGALCGEATPSYLYIPRIPRQIHERLGGGMKILAVLRDPVERSISQYRHFTARHREPWPIEAYLDYAQPRDEGYVFSAEDPLGWNLEQPRSDIVARSIYDVQLARYFACFGRENVHVLLFEELLADPQRVLDDAFAFLGLPPAPIVTEKVQNPGASLAIDPAVRPRLAARFAPANARLEKMLGRSLPWQ